MGVAIRGLEKENALERALWIENMYRFISDTLAYPVNLSSRFSMFFALALARFASALATFA